MELIESKYKQLNINAMAVKGAIVVDTEKCKGCSVCIANCPTQTIALSKEVNGKGYNFAYTYMRTKQMD